jgi:hypothetical protein
VTKWFFSSNVRQYFEQLRKQPMAALLLLAHYRQFPTHQMQTQYPSKRELSMPRGVAQPAELIKRLNALTPFPSGVVNLRYTFDDDWSGDPAIFFWITLSDEASRREVLSQNSRRITEFITQRLDPIGQWGLIPYFNFRSQSEQANLKEEVFG